MTADGITSRQRQAFAQIHADVVAEIRANVDLDDEASEVATYAIEAILETVDALAALLDPAEMLAAWERAGTARPKPEEQTDA